jgi:flagellar hook-associated protein 2
MSTVSGTGTLSAAGIGSGLDVQSIVSQLMAIEQRPLDELHTQQSDLDARISAYGQLKSALATFQTAMQDLSTPSALKVFTATSGNDSVFTATASNQAAPASYQLEVVRQAQRHKFAGAEFLDTTTFGGNAGDALTIQVGSDPLKTLTVDLSTAKTLADVKDAINNDTANPGVTASVVFGNNGNQRLVLTAADSGAANALTLGYSGGISAATFSFQEINNIAGNTALLDAEISVDGYTVNRSGNTIDDVIQGVTLDLNNADPGNQYQLDVARDTGAVADSVDSFVNAYNQLQNTIKTLKSGDLATDSGLFSIERGLRSIINTPASGLPSGLNYLGQIGVSFTRDGVMTANRTDVESALNNNFNAVSELFSTTGEGFASRLDTTVSNWLATDGLITSHTDSMDSSKSALAKRELQLQYRMTQIENSLNAQFGQLDTLLSGMKVTSDYLTQQLAVLPTFGA